MATQSVTPIKIRQLGNAEEQHSADKSVSAKKFWVKEKKLKSETHHQEEVTDLNEISMQKTTKGSITKTTTTTNTTSKQLNIETTVDLHKAETECNKKKIKQKKTKKNETDTQNISVKYSLTKFDALQKRNLIHVRSSDAGKAQEKFSNPQGEKEIKCKLCSKPVYKMEEIKAEKNIFHKNCFRCNECDKHLKVDNYQSHEGVLYCLMHFKLLFMPKFVKETETEKPTKPELIIRENQPMELPPDVIRGVNGVLKALPSASSKPDLGLEELQQLNVRSRFQVFENSSKQYDEYRGAPTRNGNVENVGVKRSTSIISKLAKLQALGFNAGISAEVAAAAYAEDDGSASYDEDDDASSTSADNGDLDLVHSKERTQRERPIGLGNAMNDIKTKFEKGHLLSKEERREERKQEIQNIRSRLFLGKQARIKEMYQQAVADSEQGITSVGKKPEIEIDGAARSLKERFEKGDLFKDAQSANGSDGGLKDEADVFESAISKKSRSIFMELDANIVGKNETNPPIFVKTKQPSSGQAQGRWPRVNNNTDQQQEKLSDAIDVVKCDEKPEYIKIETSEISEKFKFFESYRSIAETQNQGKRKEFRITPPREGVVKMPSPESENCNDGQIIPKTDQNELEKSHTTVLMLHKFREMEQNKWNDTNNRELGPRPLKCFTPPPDGERRVYQDQESDTQEEEDDDEEDEDEEENFITNARMNDEVLQEAQAAARAKQLRAKFEKWEANEIQRELNGEPCNNIYSQHISDDSAIESTKHIRQQFENMRNTETKSPTMPRYKVNRFV